MAVLSTEARRKFESSRYVGWSLTEHRERIIEGYVEVFGEHARRITGEFLDMLASGLKTTRTDLRQADLRVAGESADDGPLRDERDEAARALYALSRTLDTTITNSHGEKGAEHLGLTGTLPREPERLLQLGEFVLQQLPTLGPASVVIPGVSFDPAAFTPVYREAVERLERALEAIVQDGKENDAARAYRDRVSPRSDKVTSLAADVTSGSFRLIEEPRLQRKVRLSTKKPGVVVAVEEGEVAPGSEDGEQEQKTG